MIINKTIPILLSVFVGCVVNAQQIVTSGEDLQNATGSISYSLGVSCYSNVNNGAILEEGIQQPNRAMVTLRVNDPLLDSNISIYPNPTSDYLHLNIEKGSFLPLNIDIYDSTGKKMISQTIINELELIHLKSLSSGLYFIRIYKDRKLIKIIKIIKQ